MVHGYRLGAVCAVLICSVFTGCMYFDYTDFSLMRSTVIDDNGFPSWYLEFTTSDSCTLHVVDPLDQSLFSSTFYAGSHSQYVPLGGYRQLPRAGSYTIEAFDKYDRSIYREKQRLDTADLSCTMIIPYWWYDTQDKNYALIGLQCTLLNRGDLPGYPAEASIVTNQGSAIVALLPEVVLAGNPVTVSGLTLLSPLASERIFADIIVTDKKGNWLVQTSTNLTMDETVDRISYTWNIPRQSLDMPYPNFLYQYYSSLERRVLDDYGFYVFDPYDDTYVDLLADRLVQQDASKGDYAQINYVASFVQELAYVEDDRNDTSCEYPRYPVEMTVDKQGDCEDKAILLASLLDSLGYSVALLRLPNHMAVGVNTPENLSGVDRYIDSYYFLEATSSNTKLGFVPKKYRGLTNVTVFPIDRRPLLTHSWVNASIITRSDGERSIKMKVLIENLGRSVASDVIIRGLIDGPAGGVVLDEVTVSTIDSFDKQLVDLSFTLPGSLSGDLKTQLFYKNQMYEEKESVAPIL